MESSPEAAMKSEDIATASANTGEDEVVEWRPSENKKLRRVASGACFLKRQEGTNTLVTLHIYDLGGNVAIKGINHIFHSLGTGVFHVGVEVYGIEYSYGYVSDPPDATGLFSNLPMECQLHSYRESHIMGHTDLGEGPVDELIEELEATWKGDAYDLLECNCTTFCDEVCARLHVGNIPAWVKNLAGAGATIRGGFTFIPNLALNYAVIDAAKSGECQAGSDGGIASGAKDVLSKLGSGVDCILHVSSAVQLVTDGVNQALGRESKGSDLPASVAPPAGGSVAATTTSVETETEGQPTPKTKATQKKSCCTVS